MFSSEIQKYILRDALEKLSCIYYLLHYSRMKYQFWFLCSKSISSIITGKEITALGEEERKEFLGTQVDSTPFLEFTTSMCRLLRISLHILKNHSKLLALNIAGILLLFFVFFNLFKNIFTWGHFFPWPLESEEGREEEEREKYKKHTHWGWVLKLLWGMCPWPVIKSTTLQSGGRRVVVVREDGDDALTT